LATKELTLVSDNTASHISYRDVFTKNNMTVVPHPSDFSLFPQLKIKLKGRHLDTTEVIKAESHVVLNTLTEHNFISFHLKTAKALVMVHRHGK
jgi:hypothetical protein